MLTLFKSYRSLTSGLLLLLALIAARMCWHSSFHFGFLVWNLFLAVLPLAFSHLAVNAQRPWLMVPCVALWLLFLPNSAYLITDIIHLPVKGGDSIWLDTVILFGAAFLGVLLGLRSLQQMESWYQTRVSPRIAFTITACILLINGYGIYLGRIERWNSWDILFNTGDLIGSIAHEVRHPIRCLEVWALSGVFASGLGLGYFTMKAGINERLAEKA